MPCAYGFVNAGSVDQSCTGSPSESAFSRYIIPIIGGACDCASAWLEAQSRIAATVAERKPTNGCKHMTAIGLFIPWPWENAFLRSASSPAAQRSTPSEAGILKHRVPECLPCSTFQAKSRRVFAAFLFCADFSYAGGSPFSHEAERIKRAF